jgi:general secretion pathway protein C
MVMAAGKEFTQTLRAGFAATCELAAISTLGVSLAALAWTVAAPRGAMSAGGADGVPAHRPEPEILARLSRLSDPFTSGRVMTADAVGDATGFTLHATRAMGGGEGTAILSPSGGAQGAFAVGEEITPGVILAAVASERVEIDVGGQRMRVSFPGAGAGAVTQMATSLPADYQAAARAASPLPATAFAALPLQPVNRNGKTGFEVTPQAAGGAFSAAGLRPGDIVISINGADAASADLSTYRAQIASGQPVDIRFERDGQIHSARLGIQ